MDAKEGAEKAKEQAEKIMSQMKKMPSGGGKALAGLAAVAVGGYCIFNYGIFNVDSGHRAVMYNRVGGISEKTYGEGTHLKMPWFQRPIIYDIRAKPRNISSVSGSRDLQMVNLTLRVLSKPNATDLPKIYRTLGLDYDERVLPSIVQEVLKSVVAQFNASQLITQRGQVSLMIRRNLMERAQDFGIILDDVSITHLSFGKEYTAAIESKQVAQQDAERAKFIVEKALQDKKSMVIKAQGEAEAAKMLGDAVKNNPGFMEIRKIEAAREVANSIANANNKVYLSADSLLFNTLGGSVAAVGQKK